MGLLEKIQQIDRRVKTELRLISQDELAREELNLVKQLKLHCNETRLDIRDYEYAETMAAQRKASEHARKNLHKIEKEILQLSNVFSPADTAELGAFIDSLRSDLL